MFIYESLFCKCEHLFNYGIYLQLMINYRLDKLFLECFVNFVDEVSTKFRFVSWFYQNYLSGANQPYYKVLEN